MRTKEEIEEVMNDSISIGQCFGGVVVTEEDRECFEYTRKLIREILENTGSVTVAAKRLFEEVLLMDFNEKQWYAMVMIVALNFDFGKIVGGQKTMQYLEEMKGI